MKTSTKTILLRGVNIVGAMVVLLGVGTVAANADVCRDQPRVAINVNLGSLGWNVDHKVIPVWAGHEDRDRGHDRRDEGRRDFERR